MKRIMFGSLSMLLFAAAMLPSAQAESIASSQKNQIADRHTQILIAQKQPAMLMAGDSDGTPTGFTKEQWMTAQGTVSLSPVKNKNYKLTLKAQGLVPNGIYTLWWVNKKVIGMDLGPVGGAANNKFKANGQGNGTATITVPANNNYQMLVVAYHADNKTYGNMPGEMGKITFTHLAGDFPKLK